MSLDPIVYDVVELRELAHRRGDRFLEDGFLWPEPSEEFPPIDELTEVNHPNTWTGSLEERQKPYLDRVPDTRAASALVERWIERLVETAGFDGAVEALAYYQAMGWITESVESDLQDFLLAAGNHPGGSLADLEREVHVDSLARVIALAQMSGAMKDDGADRAREGRGVDDGDDGVVADDTGDTDDATADDTGDMEDAMAVDAGETDPADDQAFELESGNGPGGDSDPADG